MSSDVDRIARRDPRYWTSGEIARLLACSVNTVNRLFDAGELFGHRLGRQGHRRVKDRDLREFLVRIGFDTNGKGDGSWTTHGGS